MTQSFQGDVPWYMLYADKIIPIKEIKEGVNLMFEQWRKELESRVSNK